MPAGPRRPPHYPANPCPIVHQASASASSGRRGTFTEQALLTQPDLADAELVDCRTMPDVLEAVEAGEVDLGFVPIENSIEGTVNLTQDALAFNHELLIQREVVLDIEHCLMARPGTTLADVKRWCRSPSPPPSARPTSPPSCPASSSGRPTRRPRRRRRSARAVSRGWPPSGRDRRPSSTGWRSSPHDIADHAGNQTRFVLVARDGIPAPTGHDKTTLVVYQRADEPGSLISILQEFAARRINLSQLVSRPTKAGGLGDYCFVIDADGHVADELVADVLRDLHAKQGGVKFLGSYPAAGDHAGTAREHADARWRQADDWLADLRRRIR